MSARRARPARPSSHPEGPPMTSTTSTSAPLETAIDDLKSATGTGRISLGSLLDALEDRSLGFLLAAFGLLVTLPVIGAIPGLPDVASIAVVLAVAHSWIGGRQSFWAPRAVREREISARKVDRALEAMRPIGARVDRLILNDRLAFLVESTAARIAISATAVVLAVALAVLSLVPGLSALPGLGLVLLGLALMGQDGLFAALGYVATLASAATLVYAVQWML